MSYTKVSSGPVHVTKIRAASHKDLKPCPGDRPLSPRRLAALKKAILERKFASATWARARCLANNELYRINGKHTATTFADPEVPIPPHAQITLDEYVCDTLDDVSALYGTFDTKESSRTQSEINASFFQDLPGFAGIDTTLRNAMVSAVYLSKNPKNNVHSRLSAVDKAELAMTEMNSLIWILEIAHAVGVKTFNGKCRRVGTLAAMLLTYKADPLTASNFWLSVAKGDGSQDPDHATRRAERYLLTASRSARNPDVAKLGKSYFIEAERMCGTLILLFNRFQEGSNRGVIYRSTSEFPKATSTS